MVIFLYLLQRHNYFNWAFTSQAMVRGMNFESIKSEESGWQ